MPGKKIDIVIRENVIRDFKDGVSKAAMSKKYGISRSSVRRIVENPVQDIPDKIKTARQRKIEDLERRIALLESKIQAMEHRRG
jgi:hypothetical protein